MSTHFSSGTDSAPTNPNEAPKLQFNCSVTGNIDAKIDNGYLVSVNLESEELKGVLFHYPDEFHSFGSSTASGMLPHSSGYSTALEILPQREERGKSQIAVRSSSRPKPNARGYTFFFAEQYPRLEPVYHGQEKAISMEIGRLWSELTDAEKQVYRKAGETDRKKYQMALLMYRAKQRSRASSAICF